jgi:hypothetical protein
LAPNVGGLCAGIDWTHGRPSKKDAKTTYTFV